MGQLSKLPWDIVDEIEHLLVSYADKVRVRVVCTSLYSHLPKMPNLQVPHLPLLLSQSFENNTEASHALFDLSDKKFKNLHLPEAQERLFKGSSHGWVVTVGDDMPIGSSPDIYLINPLTRAKIQLPPRYTMPDVASYDADRVGREYAMTHTRGGSFFYRPAGYVNTNMIGKVVLSTTPSDEDCVAVAICTEVGKLAWCKCNDDKWKPLPRNKGISVGISVEDVIFYNGKLHALNCQGHLLVYENICSNPTFKVIAQLPSCIINISDITYLVECSDGGLAMVMRIIVEEDSFVYRTQTFRVFKLDKKNSLWVEVKEISDDMFFLGLNSSFSMSSLDFPGYKGNYIYYTANSLSFFGAREEPGACSDIGVFNLGDESLEPLPGFECNDKFLWPPPVWVMPSSF